MVSNNVDIHTLSLCSGGAGLDLGLELALGAVRTVCWVEWEAFAIEYLASAMQAGCLAQAPIWTNLRTFDGRPWRGVVDCITAGYPCQPFSLAGKRRGQADPRHLWPHVCRVIEEVEPTLVFLENVPGHLTLGFDEVARDLESLDYKVAAGLFTAEEVGASHKRERLFTLGVAITSHNYWRSRIGSTEERIGQVECGRRGFAGGSNQLADAHGARLEGRSVRECKCPGQWIIGSSSSATAHTHTHNYSHQDPMNSINGLKCSKKTRASAPRLNPVFVDWLMGWPELNGFDFSATEWSRYKQRMRSALCGLLSEVSNGKDS
jgi:site-specific DNA-cytosine methylase